MKEIFESATNRGQEWIRFAKLVLSHVDNYTVCQYKDADWENPENGDEMQKASIADIQHNLKRYVARMNSNARGATETIRDLLKISHYSCIAHGKYERGEVLINEVTKVDVHQNLSSEEKIQIKKLLEQALYGDKQITISFK